MLYLISHYWIWLALAVLLGVAVGWLTYGGARARWFEGWLPLGLLGFAAGVALTGFQVVNGLPALWLDTALLMFGFYIAGCFVGGWLRLAFGAGPVAEPVPAAAPAHVAPRQPEPADITLFRPAAPAAATVVVPVALPALPKVEGEDELAGSRPLGLAAARDGRGDDLKLISGIGRQNEARLKALGIWHFDQIAGWTEENIAWVGGYLSFPGRIEREDWVGQARRLAAGGTTEFAERARRGEVESSREDGAVVAVSEDGYDGSRPANLLAQPIDGKPDDLTLINGVGERIAERLNAIGVWHFSQIAAMSEEELRYISHAAGASGRALNDGWRGDAASLAAGEDTAHSLRLKAERARNA